MREQLNLKANEVFEETGEIINQILDDFPKDFAYLLVLSLLALKVYECGADIEEVLKDVRRSVETWSKVIRNKAN